MSQTPSEAAMDLISRRISPIPVPFRTKIPVITGWQKLRITAADVPKYFNCEPQNVGALMGEASDDLIDIDLDCLQSLSLAPHFLPATGCRFGRASKPNSHYLYRCHPAPPTTKFLDTDGKMLVEVRGTGAQTIVPPSEHESGEQIHYTDGGDPAVVDGDQLVLAVSCLAAACILARNWPKEGGRHDAAMALAGGLTRAGFAKEGVVDFVGRVAEAGGDDDVKDRQQAAADTFERVGTGEKATGWTRLGAIVGKDVATKAREWLRGKPDDPSFGSFGAAPGADAQLWRDPQSLPPALPPVLPFDYGLLPESLRGWVRDISERVQCPPDYVATSAMIAAASVVGRKVGIRPKRYDDWLVVANLWGMNIGRPGIMKTPAIQEALRPLKRLEIEAQKEFADAQQNYEAASLAAAATKDATKKKLKQAAEKGVGDTSAIAAELAGLAAPAEPVRRRYIVNDTSMEKLGELLKQNPNGVLAYRDELIGLLKSLDKEGQEGARSFWLEAWNGNGRYTFDRIGRGTLDIDAACVSVVGGTQPGPLAEYLRGAMHSGAGDDGLMQRFQLAVWPDVSRDWHRVDRFPDTAAKAKAWDVFTRLDRLGAGQALARTDENDPDGIPFLRFDDDAQDLFDGWRDELEAKVRSPDEHPAIESCLAKYRSLIPSLALLIHLIDHGGGPVGTDAMEKAIAWGVYLESHARRIFSPAVLSDVGAARALAAKILAGELPDGFARHDVYRRGWSRLSDRNEVEAAVRLLVDWDWLAETTEKTAGAPRTRYWINPKLRQQSPPKTDAHASGGTEITEISPPADPSFGFCSSSGGVNGEVSSAAPDVGDPDELERQIRLMEAEREYQRLQQEDEDAAFEEQERAALADPQAH